MNKLGTLIYSYFFGKFIGKDEYGNNYYYKKPKNSLGREKRWVIYNGIVEPTKIPADWYRWMHHITDKLPKEENFPDYFWQRKRNPNYTGTSERYLPKSSILRDGKRAKVSSDYESWKPKN